MPNNVIQSIPHYGERLSEEQHLCALFKELERATFLDNVALLNTGPLHQVYLFSPNQFNFAKMHKITDLNARLF